MSTATVKNLIDEFIHLPLDDKEYVVEIIKKQLIEAKREAICQERKNSNGQFQEENDQEWYSKRIIQGSGK